MRCARASTSPSTKRASAASTSSRAIPSARWPRSEKLELLVEDDFALERAVHRAARDDLHQPLALVLGQLLGQLHRDLEARGGAALGRLVLDVDADVADVPALAVGIHLERDCAARGEARCEQLLR